MTDLSVVPTGQIQTDPAPSFDDFWVLWPADRRVCKKQAREQWARMSPEAHVAALVGLAGWRRVWEARGEWQFVPHPHRWLRDERYEDELPAGVTGPTHASHVLACPNPAARTVIPEHVRAMLARLRGRT